MKTIFKLSAFILSGIICTACCSRGKLTLAALQRTVEKTAERAKQSVVYVTVLDEASRTSRKGPGKKVCHGIIVSKKGHVLIPMHVKVDTTDRIEVLLGDVEYLAEIFKSDDHMQLSILKINAEREFMPLSINESVALKVGEWGIVVETSGEDKEYETFASLLMCKGEIAKRYRRYLFSPAIPESSHGAPVLSIDGKLAGIVSSGSVLASSDLCEDLNDLMTSERLSPEEEVKQKGWLGVFLQPINREYAKAHNLPRSGLWILKSVKGGSASEAGLKEGDLITALNGSALRFSGDRAKAYFMKKLRPKKGRDFNIKVLRDGKEYFCSGSFIKKPEEESIQADDIGIIVKDVTDEDIFLRDLYTEKGVVITGVYSGSPAALKRLRAGDVIVEIDGELVADVEDFGEILENIRANKKDHILMRYWRNKMTLHSGLRLERSISKKGGK